MNLGTLILFFILSAISGIVVLYLILLGMAPGVSPLNWTGWLLLAIILQICAWAINKTQHPIARKCLNLISWIALGLLLLLQLIMIIDFNT